MQYYYPPEPSWLDMFAPRITRILIFLNLVIWILQERLPEFVGWSLTAELGMRYFEAEAFRPYQLLSYMFLHGSFSHFFSNMFQLWMLGSTIEHYWGERRYILYYLATGLTAALTQQAVWYLDFHEVALHANQMVQLGVDGPAYLGRELLNLPMTIGASGAVFGIILATAASFPDSRIILLTFPIPIKVKYLVFLLGAYELYSGVHATGSNIAHFAHLGGMIGGALLIWLWRKTHRQDFEIIYPDR